VKPRFAVALYNFTSNSHPWSFKVIDLGTK